MDIDAQTRVLVTGAASGLGEALADVLEGRGARVLRTDRLPSAGVYQLDVTSETQFASAIAHAAAEYGGLDLLINNAGVAGGGRLEYCDLDEWRWLLDVNLLGVVRGTRAVSPLFEEQRHGAILNIASLAGLVHPAGMASYNAVKAAVVALTETTGHELAGIGVTAHVACPSYFRSGLASSLRSNDPAVSAVMGTLIEGAQWDAAQMAEAILKGLAAGQELIVPDPAAKRAYKAKRKDRKNYDKLMRDQAAKLRQR